MSHAQSAEDSVKAVVNNLFRAMKNSDVVLLKSVFVPVYRPPINFILMENSPIVVLIHFHWLS